MDLYRLIELELKLNEEIKDLRSKRPSFDSPKEHRVAHMKRLLKLLEKSRDQKNQINTLIRNSNG